MQFANKIIEVSSLIDKLSLDKLKVCQRFYFISLNILTSLIILQPYPCISFSQGCLPYEVPACDHHEPGPHKPCGDIVPTPRCVKKCEAGYNKTYSDDKHYGKLFKTLNLA